ncbi:MAG: DUF6290 family protein [Sarcina sp.]
MGLENKKNDSLTVRLERKTKEDLKKLAKNKGLTVSELVNKLLVEKIERENFKNSSKDQLENRTIEFEKKLINLKNKIGW